MSSSNSYDWSEDKIIQLIELVRDRSVLWDPQNSLYKNKSKRLDAFKGIAEELHIFPDEVERKWKVIQAQFRREHRKMKTKPCAGSNELYSSLWFGYKHMEFLRDKYKPKNPKQTTEVNLQHKESICNDDDEVSQISSEMDMNTSIVDSVNTRSEELCQESQPKKHFVSLKSVRKRAKTINPRIEKAINILQSYSRKRENRDSCAVFGEHIANKLRTYDLLTRADIEYEISCILHEADIRMLQASKS